VTIRVRLTTWYAVVGATTLLLLGVFVWLQYAAALRRSLDDVLRARAGAVQALLEADPRALPDVGSLERGLFLVVLGSGGRAAYASPGAPSISAPSAGFSVVRKGGAADEIYSVSQGDQTIVAGASVADIDRNLDSLSRTLMLVGAAGAIVLVIGGWWLAGRALAPVAELTRDADAIGSSDLELRLPESVRRDELGALARTLNRMLDRVEEAVRRQRAFVTGASHDLRTPLATLRTELELALAEPNDRGGLLAAVEGAHADAVRLSELAGGLLRLAAAESDGRPLDLRDVPLTVLVHDSLELVEQPGGEPAVAVDIEAPDGPVHVDRTRIVQALVNLLGNAIRHAPQGSSVGLRIRVEPGPAAASILRVDVVDDGPGVEPDLRGVLFQPFARSRSDPTSGTGLGLATAAAAVHAHGGAIGYEDRVGGGARFWFWVPA